LSGVEVAAENLDSGDESEEPTGEVVSVKSNISGTVSSSNLDSAKPIRKGQPLLTLTSMKMESYVVAPADGYVVDPAPGIGEEGKVVKVGDFVCSFRPEKLAENVARDERPVETWEKEIEEIDLRRRLARGLGGPKAVAAQKTAGRLNLRERIDLLLDKDTFFEFGKTAGTPVRDAEGNIVDVVPGNFVLGTGEVAKRQVVVGGEDFTIRKDRERSQVGIGADSPSLCSF
jgi:hypothetical protein